ncbi:MAG: multifunctional CCA addition/repair protein [Gammaproteobacteria bacterium]
MQVYLVGGAVRDKLLGHEVQERDWVVVGATSEQMIQQGYQQVGKDFPVFLHPTTKEEYALARTERKSGKGYSGFTCYAAPDVTLQQDLLRRDLTINAMAQDDAGNIIDPFGGQRDLQHKILRHVSPAFTEDPLRILRLARFYARYAPLGFTIAEETQALLLAMVRAGEVSALVPDRVWQEIEKVLGEAQPQLFFDVLRRCGALAILFPELDNLFGVPNPVYWHPEIDSGVHTMMALTQAARLTENKQVRFAVLVHDLGKAVTAQKDWPSHPDHGPKGVPLIRQLAQRYPIPRQYQELAILVSNHHIACHKSQQLKPEELLTFLENLDVFRRPERFQQFLLACEADFRGRTGNEHEIYQQSAHLCAIYKVIAAVKAQDFIAQGIAGSAIAQALRQHRLALITDYMERLHH